MKKVRYGIILGTFDTSRKFERFVTLMVKKRITYEFHDFVFGKYKRDDQSIMDLLTNMTYYEKSLILSQDFMKMYDHFKWTDSSQTYMESKRAIFYNNWGKKSDFNRLVSMIKRSYCSDTIMEFPKGRANVNETPLESAKREFLEETGFDSSSYTLIDKQFVDEFTDGGVVYRTEFFLAIAPSAFDLQKKFSEIEALGETVSVHWMSARDIETMNFHPRIKSRIQNQLSKCSSILIQELKQLPTLMER
jgi:8-oxo-dGTP pyrophosphatase MutT (NUDIX family)